MKKFSLLLIIILFLALAGGTMAMSSDNFRLDWFVPLTAGGGHSAGSSNYIMHTTVGQTVIGHTESANYQTGFGYWGGLSSALSQHEVYLPLVLR